MLLDSGAYKFVVLKKLQNAKSLDINLMIKVFNLGRETTFKGQLFCSSFTPNLYSLLLYSNGEVKVLYDFEKSTFEKTINLSTNSDFSLLLIEKSTSTPLLFSEEDVSVLPKTIIDNFQKTKSSEYDDFLIADTNYYEGELNDTEDFHIKTTTWEDKNKESKGEEEKSDSAILYENFENSNEQNYYEKVREKLEKLLSEKDKDLDLIRIIPNGKFVKIKYNENSFYSVGIIYEKGSEKYVCYAVKGSYSKIPKALTSYAVFIPLSSFDSLGDGYYVIFQNAKTGEIIKN